MKRNIFMLSLVILIAAFSFSPVMAQACSCQPVEITKFLFCNSDKPEYFVDDTGYYYVGKQYTWWIKIIVTAYANLSSVKVYDRLGAELKIEGISVGTDFPIEYNFTYNPYGKDGEVWINGIHEGYLNKDGVSFDGFNIYWTGNSVKAHLEWDVGSMVEGETTWIHVIVSTDTNPAGMQEYTSCGTYWLNSGATVKAILESTGKQFSDESNSIQVNLVYPPPPS